MQRVQIKYLIILLGLAFSRCGSEQNSPKGFIDFKNKKIVLSPDYKYSYIDVYWEDASMNKNNKRIEVKTNDVTFNELTISDSVDFNLVLKIAKVVQVDIGNEQLGIIWGVHFLIDTLKSDKLNFKRVIE